MDKSSFFDAYYNNARINSILIMNCDGTILDINSAFTNNFGYTVNDIKGKNFKELFTPIDKKQTVPETELKHTINYGQADDEVFIIDKSGKQVWCSGETILVANENGEKYIVKDIINLQSKKHINLILNNTEEILERIFEASKDIPMMILDGSMKIQNVNQAFIDFFEITSTPFTNSSLSSLNQPFWNRPEIRGELSDAIVKNKQLKQKEFIYQSVSGQKKKILIDTKTVYGQPGTSRKIFILIEWLN